MVVVGVAYGFQLQTQGYGVRHFLLLCLVLVTACRCTDKAEEQARADGLYFSAFEAIDSRHLTKAREQTEALEKLSPKDKRLPTLWALLALAEFRFEEALPLLEAALQNQPERVDLWRHKGELLQSKKQYAQAKLAFEKVLNLQPNDTEVRQSMAECLLDLGEVEQALVHLKEAAQQALLKRQADAVVLAVEAMNQHGRAEEVGPWLESLVSKTEEPSFLFELMAHAHVQAGEFAKAIKALEEAVKTHPEEVYYWEALSTLYEREKDTPRAQNALERGLEKAPPPQKASLHLLLAQLCKRMAEPGCLQEHTQKALEHIDGKSAERLQELAALLVDIGKETEAFSIYWALADEPSGKQNPLLQKQTAQLASKLGKTQEATQACQRLRQLEPQTPCP